MGGGVWGNFDSLFLACRMAYYFKEVNSKSTFKSEILKHFMNMNALIHKTHIYWCWSYNFFLKNSYVATPLMHFLNGVSPPLWSLFLGCDSVTLPFRVCFGCLLEQGFLCLNQESIMKHCLLQYQTCEVSAKLIGRENILPSPSGRVWSQENGNGKGVGKVGESSR